MKAALRSRFHSGAMVMDIVISRAEQGEEARVASVLREAADWLTGGGRARRCLSVLKPSLAERTSGVSRRFAAPWRLAFCRPRSMPITSSTHLHKDAIKALPDYTGLPLGAVQVVSDSAALERACQELTLAGVVGFDTESRPTFRKGEESEGPHLIQLAGHDRAWLIPVALHADLAPLKALLESAAVLKVGFDLKSDRRRLQDKFGITCAGLVEVGELCREAGEHHSIGAVQAVARLFGQYFRKSKRVSTSNWASRVLSDAQQLYAANDAHVALRVYQALQHKQ